MYTWFVLLRHALLHAALPLWQEGHLRIAQCVTCSFVVFVGCYGLVSRGVGP